MSKKSSARSPKVTIGERGPGFELKPVRERRAETVAGAYDADRGAKLVRGADRTRAQVLVDAIVALGDRGRSALQAAFPNCAHMVVAVDAARVIEAAGGKLKTMKTLARLAEDEGAAVSPRRKRLDRAQETMDAIRAKYADRPAAFDRMLLRAFRGLAQRVEELNLEEIVRQAVEAADVMARLESVATMCDAALSAKDVRKLRGLDRRVDAYGAAAVDAANKKGAVLPPGEQMGKRSWRVEVVDTPEGSIAKPAYVVLFDANAPIGRLSRAARPGDRPALERGHVLAAEQVCALYSASMKGAKLVRSYDGVVVQGGGAGAHMIDVACEAWRKLDSAMAELLPVERSVVMEVCVYETPIEMLARRGDLVHFSDLARGKGAIVQTLRCGLQRLAQRWSIDVGQPHDASK